MCDKEIIRIKNTLTLQYPGRYILFAPKNIEGLRFKVIESINSEIVYRLDNGEIIPPNEE